MIKPLIAEERKLWKQLASPTFEPEQADAMPDALIAVVEREFVHQIAGRILLELAIVGLTILTVTLLPPYSLTEALSRWLPVLAFVVCGGLSAVVFFLPPSRRWLNAILYAVDLASDLTPDSVVRLLLTFVQRDRYLRYRKNSYSRFTLHKTLEDALLRTKHFVATEEECRFFLEIVRGRDRYTRPLRQAALEAIAPPGIALTDALRREVEALTTSPAVGDTVKSQARELLRRS